MLLREYSGAYRMQTGNISKELTPLAGTSEGASVEIGRIHGGAGVQNKLAGMGLRPGTRVFVVKNAGRGPMLLAVNHTRFMMGRAMAEKVDVVGDPFDHE